MRTELAVALITKSDGLNTRTFLFFCVVLSQHCSIIGADGYLFPLIFTLESTSVLTKLTHKRHLKHCGQACYDYTVSALYFYISSTDFNNKGGKYLMWFGRAIKCGIMGMASTDCRKFGKQNKERSHFSKTSLRKEAPR